MSNQEHLIAIIPDIVLPVDAATRYDLRFTDKRIAIISMGASDRFSHHQPFTSLTGITPTMPYVEKPRNIKTVEEEINSLPLDEVLKLSKKNCFYTYGEIEEVKLAAGKTLKFAILSKDCISKFLPTQDQFEQLSVLLLKIEALKGKITISGTLPTLETMAQEENQVLFCKFCSSSNDLDAVFCQNCGRNIQGEGSSRGVLAEVTCSSCGTKNKLLASFCKKCGCKIAV